MIRLYRLYSNGLSRQSYHYLLLRWRHHRSCCLLDLSLNRWNPRQLCLFRQCRELIIPSHGADTPLLLAQHSFLHNNSIELSFPSATTEPVSGTSLVAMFVVETSSLSNIKLEQQRAFHEHTLSIDMIYNIIYISLMWVKEWPLLFVWPFWVIV